MGTNYSQPPRGYQYSTQHFENQTDILEVEPEFSSFYELYHNEYQNIMNLPYLLQNVGHNIVSYSYDQCLKMCQSLLSFFVNNHIKNDSVIAVFSKSSFKSQIVCNTALLFGYRLIISSPESKNLNDFIKSLKIRQPFAIYCEAENAKALERNISFKSLIITDTNSANCFDKIANYTSKSYQSGPPQPHKESDVCLTYILSSSEINLKFSDIFYFINSWSEKWKICRDATVSALLPFDDNVLRLLNFLVIYNRAKLCFPSTMDEVKLYKTTHLFLSPNLVTQEIEELKKSITKRSIIYKIGYATSYFWKKTWVSWGCQTPKTDKRFFEKLQKDLGNDLHFAFCSGSINRDVHEAWIVLYAKPLCTIFLPTEWGNAGSSLPCDARFIKYGTMGGPVENCIAVDKENNNLINRLNKQHLNKTGFFDEEGALVFNIELKQE